MITASVDLRVQNQFMERNRIAPGTYNIFKDFIYKFHVCTVFSNLDRRQGYHQLLLDLESRKSATFSTPWGNIRLVWSRRDKVQWTEIHKRRIKAKPRENQSCKTKQPTKIKRSCETFPWHDRRISIKVHPKSLPIKIQISSGEQRRMKYLRS